MSEQQKPKSIIHILVGNKMWKPTEKEIAYTAKLFQEANLDATLIATRRGVSASYLKFGNDVEGIVAGKTRGIMHIEVGEEGWVPTQEELDQVKDLFSSADPNSDVIVTRLGITAMFIKD